MDISFPASTLILSNLFPKQDRDIAASLINTIVNYSISLGLGIAGTVESQIKRNRGNSEAGFKSALRTSVGLSGLGLVSAFSFALARR